MYFIAISIIVIPIFLIAFAVKLFSSVLVPFMVVDASKLSEMRHKYSYIITII